MRSSGKFASMSTISSGKLRLDHDEPMRGSADDSDDAHLLPEISRPLMLEETPL